MEKILVGKVLKTHGLKGELKVKSLSDNGDRYFDINKIVYIENKEYLIKKVRFHKGCYLLTFNEYEDINLVLHLHSKEIYSTLDNDKLSEGQFYLTDLLGLEVYSNARLIGKVVDLIENPLQDVLVIKSSNDVKNLIPYVDAFIKDVDLDKKIIEINEIEGLINED